MQEHLSGIIEHIIFRNEENAYTVMNVSTEDGDMTVVGYFPDAHEGVYLEADGSFLDHAVYGVQFRAEKSSIRVPDAGLAFERYLGSGAIKGVGEKLARSIIRHFGDDAARILREEPERLAEVKGISIRGAQRIAQQMAEQAQMQNAMAFLAGFDISLSLASKIYNFYQDDLYRVLRENPYRLAEDIPGVGFKLADRIAAKAGIRPDSAYRIRSGIVYLLSRAALDGHCFLPRDILFDEARELLSADEEMLSRALMDLSIEKKIVCRARDAKGQAEKMPVYLARLYFLELNTARMLHDLNIRCAEDTGRVERQLAAALHRDGLNLDEMQARAVKAAVCNGVTILTGGPGTGKTTTINAMIRYFIAEGMEIVLAAPTGRAAKRMTEATGYAASTIHRLLEANGAIQDARAGEARFARNGENPLEADVVIIDESSMMDIYLMHALLSALVPGTRLVLVGDVNQLPSVGPGAVLADLIRARAFEVVQLVHIFRQAAESDIVVNAHRIRRGERIEVDNKSRDFFFLERNDVRVIQRVVLSLVMEKLPRYVDADPFDIQVLTPMRKGALGVESLNGILQRYLNPPSPDKEEVTHAGVLFRLGDKVMQTQNDYQLAWEVRGVHGIAAQTGSGIFNGDMGIVTRIDAQSERMEVCFDDGRIAAYSFSQLDELELAYAITVHKSQGSEYPAVVIPLLFGPPMLMNRNLLYTAVTRARSCVVLVGEQAVFQEMIDNETEASRYTALAWRMEELKSP